jgi:hypothetical protein
VSFGSSTVEGRGARKRWLGVGREYEVRRYDVKGRVREWTAGSADWREEQEARVGGRAELSPTLAVICRVICQPVHRQIIWERRQ